MMVMMMTMIILVAFFLDLFSLLTTKQNRKKNSRHIEKKIPWIVAVFMNDILFFLVLYVRKWFNLQKFFCPTLTYSHTHSDLYSTFCEWIRIKMKNERISFTYGYTEYSILYQARENNEKKTKILNMTWATTIDQSTN